MIEQEVSAGGSLAVFHHQWNTDLVVRRASYCAVRRAAGPEGHMEWFTLLEAVGTDASKGGRMTAYADETLTFERAASGEVRALVIGGTARLPRLAVGQQSNCRPSL